MMILYIRKNIQQKIPIFLSCLFLFFYVNTSFSQAQTKFCQIYNPKFLLKTTLGDFEHIFTSPLRMSKTDGLKISILSATTAGLVFYLDEWILEEYTGNEGGFPNVIGHKLALIGKEYGRKDNRIFYLFGGLSTSMLMGGLFLDDKKLLKTTGLMTESFVLALFIMGSAKMVLGRSRPYTEKGSTDFDIFAFSGNKDSRSMPSGHTSSAFAMLTVIAKHYDHWYIKIPSYVFAAGAAVQRVESRQHWISDVLVGGLIGYFVADTLVKKHTENNTCDNLSVKPFVLADRIGLFFFF